MTKLHCRLDPSLTTELSNLCAHCEIERLRAEIEQLTKERDLARNVLETTQAQQRQMAAEIERLTLENQRLQAAFDGAFT